MVGLLRLRWGDYPKIAHTTIQQLKEQKTVDYQPIFKSLTVAFFILIFGAGVGPEATLLGALVMLSVWHADKIRYILFNQQTLATLPTLQKIGRIIHPTNYLTTYTADKIDSTLTPLKKYFNLLFIMIGITTFIILMRVTNQPSFISYMGESHWQFHDFLLFVPLIIFGFLVGKTYTAFSKKITILFTFWAEKPVKKTLIGSLAIFIVAMLTPNLLFSGQIAMGNIPTDYTLFSVLTLVLIVSVNLLFLQICLNTGWIGGDIFPIVFSAFILGFGISQLFPTVDTLFIVSTVASTMTFTILSSSLIATFFIALFFPLKLFPIIVLAVFALKSFQSLIKKK
ncbi:chloride channel protein [Vagococcus intermedius]|uniref:chloride channel protein n=1 Tax=Vagococcus intermedius TaxID=2991418 RepID=UPI0023B84569|nr:chloride channel protein [Vagococcus intermedius]WEG75655.1 chloride channel protein [Vagococcus intermedius]